MFLVGPSWLLKLSRKAWNPKKLEKLLGVYGFWWDRHGTGSSLNMPEIPKTLKNHLFFKVFGETVLALEAL